MPNGNQFDVLTMGRIGVDIYPLQIGRSLRQVETFGKYLGGSATNVAVAAARYGRRSAVITRTGRDPFGEFLHDALRGFGVDDRYVEPVDGLPTPVTFCEIFPPDDFPLYFYRFPTAPDLQITAKELDINAIRSATVFWVTVTGLCQEPSRSATMAALRARDRRGLTVLDLDYRPMFWDSREAARHEVAQALPYVTVAVGNLDECETAVGHRAPRAAAAALHAAGVELAVVKQGPAGVFASDRRAAAGVFASYRRAAAGVFAPDRRAAAGVAVPARPVGVPARPVEVEVPARPVGVPARPVEVEVPALPVEVVNGIGAGDAFGGALCHALISGWDLAYSMRFCNAAGALVATRLACADAMPTGAEVETMLEETIHG